MIIALALLAACGPDPAVKHADQTVEAGWDVITQAETTVSTTGGEYEIDRHAARAVQRARDRYGQAEGVVQTWLDEGTGRLGWVTVAPCLAASLDGIERTFTAARLPIPPDLDQARAMAAESSEGECAETELSPSD